MRLVEFCGQWSAVASNPAATFSFGSRSKREIASEGKSSRKGAEATHPIYLRRPLFLGSSFQKRKTKQPSKVQYSNPKCGQDGPREIQCSASNGGPAVASWASIFLDYFDSKARLLAVESREALGHFTWLLVLLGVMLFLDLCSVLMYGTSLLYLVALLFHLAWGWSALICGMILTQLSILAFFVPRIRLRQPVFQTTLKDLEKDKEWLIQSKTKAS